MRFGGNRHGPAGLNQRGPCPKRVNREAVPDGAGVRDHERGVTGPQPERLWREREVLGDRARAADLERLCGTGPKRIFDLGAGSGGPAAAMADLGHTVVAVEISPVRATHARGRLPLTGEERKRLERKRGEAGDFVPGLERVLIAVDQSANGQFAARLAGLFVGSRQIMTTVLAVGGRPTGHQGSADPPPADIVRTTAEAVAAQAAAQNERRDAAAGGPVSVAAREGDRTSDAVLREAKKGYDLMFVGIARPPGLRARDVPFDPEIEQIAKTFEGAIGIVIANGEDLRKPLDAPLDILVPVSGTDYSRRAAEVALAISAASRARVTTLYVSSRPRAPFWLGRGHGPDPREMEILNDITRLAERQGVNLAASLTARGAPEDAIAQEIRKGKHTLVVLGVKMRPGNRLYFGHVPTVLQEDSLCSLLLVSS